LVAPSSSLTAIVAARDEETRILLRGLLRLRHFRILGEAEGSTHGAELLKSQQPGVLVVDANLAEGSSATLIREARQASPHTRVILVGPPAKGGHSPAPATAAEPDVTLPRPFGIAQFEAAVRPAELNAAPPTPTD
jgi:DNA-binding NarL/FixJ family response regulator